MRQENVLQRSLRSVRSFFEPSSVSESDIKRNVFLAKRDDQYSTNPNEFNYRESTQHTQLPPRQQIKGFMLMNDERLYSIEYSVSIIPEAGFRMLYCIFDAIGGLLQAANDKNILLHALGE